MKNLSAICRTSIRTDMFAGAVVALALIPEALAFSVVAGVDPKVGLYAAFSIAVTSAIVGGRPGMISAATGAVALLIVPLVRQHGVEYVFAAGMVAGALQIAAGLLRLGELMRFVSQSVVTGFVNGLAILIFMAQLPQVRNASPYVYIMVIAGLLVIYLTPRLTTMVPSPLVCVALLTAIAAAFHLPVPAVGDMGALPMSLPSPAFPSVPVAIDTLWVILPYSVAIAAVSLLESLMTAAVVDDFTDTTSDKNRECIGQGMSNVVTSLLGGMPGCAMIGQTVVNLKSGGRGRLSTFVAGVLLLVFIVYCGQWVKRIPMAALVAVMAMVSISTFRWRSVLDLAAFPKSSSVVMVATVAVVVVTGNLAIGVLVGVLLSALFFVSKMQAQFNIESTFDAGTNERTYLIAGEMFYASAGGLHSVIDYAERVDSVRIDLSQANVVDVAAVDALDRAVSKLKKNGIRVDIVGANDASASMIRRHSKGKLCTPTE